MSNNNLSPTDQAVRELAKAVMDLEVVAPPAGGTSGITHRGRKRLAKIVEDIDNRPALNPGLVVAMWQDHAKALERQLKDTEHQRDKALADLEMVEHERDQARASRQSAINRSESAEQKLDKADSDFNKLAERVKQLEEERDCLIQELDRADNQRYALEKSIDAARAAGANVMADIAADANQVDCEAAVPAEEPETWRVTRPGPKDHQSTATHTADTHTIDNDGMLTLYLRGDVVARYPRGDWVCLARIQDDRREKAYRWRT